MDEKLEQLFQGNGPEILNCFEHNNTNFYIEKNKWKNLVFHAKSYKFKM